MEYLLQHIIEDAFHTKWIRFSDSEGPVFLQTELHRFF